MGGVTGGGDEMALKSVSSDDVVLLRNGVGEDYVDKDLMSFSVIEWNG